MPEPLELDDMQRLILDGYATRSDARYALLEVAEPGRARAWLASALPRVGRANDRDKGAQYGINVAFTFQGLIKFGLQRARGFLAPFREGMGAPGRALALGDDPQTWRWGKDRQPIHVLLMVFSEAGKREEDWTALRPGLEAWANNIDLLDGFLNRDRKEHFGFRDGISQPYIEGSQTSRRPAATEAATTALKPGEFILGYLNESGFRATSPTIEARMDRDKLLPVCTTDCGRRDFGRNGTYLVLRQLRQKVEDFEEYLKNAGGGSADVRERIAAKIVGRWRSGAPLVNAPYADCEELRTDNDFLFYDRDRFGHSCPLGAHIRRANPRDALVDEGRGITPAAALRQSRRHRIIRRGRLYDCGSEKGLLFLCLNANIQDQFEFVQHNWINSPRFGGLSGETDPVIGPRPKETSPLTIQGPSGSHRLELLPRFVDVVGGLYLFLPGMRALKCLTRL